MKTNFSLSLIAAIITLASNVMLAQTIEETTTTSEESFWEDTQLWGNAGVGIGSKGWVINGGISLQHGSAVYGVFIGSSSDEPNSQTTAGALYGVGGGNDLRYSVAGGLAYVNNSEVRFGTTTINPDGTTTNNTETQETNTIGIPLQAHVSMNYYAIGIDLGLHACISAKSSVAVTLGLNVGKLW